MFMRACCVGDCIGYYLFHITFNRLNGSDEKTVETSADNVAGQVLELIS
jgi:hypothetical protein